MQKGRERETRTDTYRSDRQAIWSPIVIKEGDQQDWGLYKTRGRCRGQATLPVIRAHRPRSHQ